MLQAQMPSEIVRYQIRITTGKGSAHRTHHLQAGIDVLRTDVIDQSRIREAHSLAVRTRKALRLLGTELFARVEQLKVGARQNALHRMIGRVPGTGDAILVANGAQIVVVADQTFVTTAAKVAL